jgi:probable addiction module antidote protein
MRKYRSLSNVEEGYLRDHPDEIDGYIAVLFEEYAKDSDTASLLSSLRIVGRVKGVSRLAEASGLSRKGIQKVLSEDGNPKFESVNAIMHAMGYRLAVEKLNHSDLFSPLVNSSCHSVRTTVFPSSLLADQLHRGFVPLALKKAKAAACVQR